MHKKEKDLYRSLGKSLDKAFLLLRHRVHDRSDDAVTPHLRRIYSLFVFYVPEFFAFQTRDADFSG